LATVAAGWSWRVVESAEPVAKASWIAGLVDPLFLLARNRSDRHRDSQRLILGVDRWGITRLPKFRGKSGSPFATGEEVGIGNDDPQQSVIHC
jgi:hypothetical protein